MPGNRLYTPLPGFQGVGASQTASVNLPMGRTIHGIALSFSGVTLAQLTGIRVRLNSEEVLNLSATELDNANIFDGAPSCASGGTTIDRPLIIWSDRLMMLGLDGSELTAWGTGSKEDPNPIVTGQLELDIAAGATPAVTGSVIQSGPGQSGFLRKVRKYTRAAAGAGTFQIVDLPRTGLLNRLFLASSVITGVRILADNLELFKRTATENTQVQNSYQYRHPVSNIFAVDFSETGAASLPLNLNAIQDFRLELTMSGAGTVGILMDTMDPLRS